jgi:hypothetical protein
MSRVCRALRRADIFPSMYRSGEVIFEAGVCFCSASSIRFFPAAKARELDAGLGA